MLPANIDHITETDLNALITSGVRESRSIEYKAALKIGSDEEKKEFLADVSSFANSFGGDLIIGMAATDGIPTDLCGLDGFNPDSDSLRVEEIVRSSVAPRMLGMQLRSLPLTNGKPVLVIRIPQSLHRPHMVVYKGSSRFFGRHSTGKYPLDVHELRAAFRGTSDVMERVRQYRLDRLHSIMMGQTPEILGGKNLVCLHVIPLESFNPSFSFDTSRIAPLSEGLMPMYSSGGNQGRNFDGPYSVFSGGAQALGYVQLFRNGILESVDSLMLDPRDGGKRIASIAYEEHILLATAKYCAFFQKHNIPAPFVVGLSFLNVQGYHMSVSQHLMAPRSARTIDRDHLILPELYSDTWTIDPGQFLHSTFDQIWNACGWERDINYDATGKWVGHQ